jgi:hypothetical protein
MAVRGEEVAGSIDAQVRESIEKMVAEIRSSVEDVRGVVDSQLKAALQSVQADVNSISFLPQIRKAISELEETFEASRPAAVAAPASSGAHRIKAAVHNIERGKSQVDILNGLLEQCLEFGSRASLLILRGETFSGWKGVGFAAHGGNDDLIKRFNAAPGLIPELDRVLRNEQVVSWDGANLATRLGVSGGEQAVLVPMVIKDKVSAAVFVDATSEDAAKFDRASIELLVFTTGLLVDTLAIRKKIPSPSLTEEGDVAAAPAAAPASAPPAAVAPPRPAPPPAAAPTPAPPKPAPPAPAAPAPEPAVPRRTDAGTVAINAAQLREMMAAQRPSFNVPAADEFSGGAPTAPHAKIAPPPAAPPTPAPAAPPAPAPAPTPAPAAPAAAPALGAAEDRPSTQYIPPANVARAGVLGGGAQPEDMKKHDEARRFARLLVSEIKLYNESKVEQGRKNRDLYERLKEDIDRSRQMYDERIADEVRKVSNYFYDELVRILADGKAESLGL